MQLSYHIFITIAHKGMDVNRVRLALGDSTGTVMADKKKSLDFYSKLNKVLQRKEFDKLCDTLTYYIV